MHYYFDQLRQCGFTQTKSVQLICNEAGEPYTPAVQRLFDGMFEVLNIVNHPRHYDSFQEFFYDYMVGVSITAQEIFRRLPTERGKYVDECRMRNHLKPLMQNWTRTFLDLINEDFSPFIGPEYNYKVFRPVIRTTWIPTELDDCDPDFQEHWKTEVFIGRAVVYHGRSTPPPMPPDIPQNIILGDLVWATKEAYRLNSLKHCVCVDDYDFDTNPFPKHCQDISACRRKVAFRTSKAWPPWVSTILETEQWKVMKYYIVTRNVRDIFFGLSRHGDVIRRSWSLGNYHGTAAGVHRLSKALIFCQC